MNSIQLNIDLSFQQLVEVVKKLSPKDKLKLNEIIWDADSLVPEEHQLIVAERKEKAKKNPKRMKEWDEVVQILKR
jgi:hypothetical protein